MARLKPRHLPTVSLPLGQRIVSTTGRHQFYTVRIVDGQAMPAFKASGDITSMFVRIGNRFFELRDRASLQHGDLVARCQALIAGNTQTNAKEA